MKVTRYEIDMLDVKNADAFLIHFWDDDTNYDYVVLIDGGNYQDGTRIANFIRKHYGRNKNIDLVICSHCDKDHFGGITYLLEQQKDDGQDNMNIDQIWINDPAKHVKSKEKEIKWSSLMNLQTKMVKARSVYDIDGHSNLFDIIDNLKDNNRITMFEPFSDASETDEIGVCANGLFQIIGPTKKYYESLVLDFRNDLQRKKGGYDSDESREQESVLCENIVFSNTLDDADDDPSSHNKSSVILLFQPSDDNKFLFMGDACRDSINNIPENLKPEIQSVYWLKVPHHGSKHNLDSDIINHIHPKIAFISTENYGHYLSKAVVNALNKIGTKVYSTNNNSSMCHHKNTPTHSGYSPATPIK